LGYHREDSGIFATLEPNAPLQAYCHGTSR
jgi:hypothetical protein